MEGQRSSDAQKIGAGSDGSPVKTKPQPPSAHSEYACENLPSGFCSGAMTSAIAACEVISAHVTIKHENPLCDSSVPWPACWEVPGHMAVSGDLLIMTLYMVCIRM
jgi:hypothetical protein